MFRRVGESLQNMEDVVILYSVLICKFFMFAKKRKHCFGEKEMLGRMRETSFSNFVFVFLNHIFLNREPVDVTFSQLSFGCR